MRHGGLAFAIAPRSPVPLDPRVVRLLLTMHPNVHGVLDLQTELPQKVNTKSWSVMVGINGNGKMVTGSLVGGSPSLLMGPIATC